MRAGRWTCTCRSGVVDEDRANAVCGRGATSCMTPPPARLSLQLDRAAMHDNMLVLLTQRYTRDGDAHHKAEARGKYAAKRNCFAVKIGKTSGLAPVPWGSYGQTLPNFDVRKRKLRRRKFKRFRPSVRQIERMGHPPMSSYIPRNRLRIIGG